MSSRPLIAVDIGNSSTKLGWDFVTSNQLPVPAQTAGFKTGECPPEELLALLPRPPVQWAIVSVHREGCRLLREWLADRRPEDFVQLLAWRDLSLEVHVAAPERVGLDRLAAAVAANFLRQVNRAAIVIDAGSAITVDLVSADGAFEGGAILPGFRMSAEALYSADLLPLTLLAPNDQPPPVLGKDTESAIRSALFWGSVGAVRELVKRMAANLAVAPDIFVTGGDLRELSSHLEGSRFVPNMVLAGIALAVERSPDSDARSCSA